MDSPSWNWPTPIDTVMPGNSSPVERRVILHSAMRAADAFGDRRAGGEIGAGKHGDQLLAAIAGRQIVLAHPLAQRFRHQPEHLVADAVAEIVVEPLEMVDVDQEHAERLTLLHRLRLRGAEKFLQRAAVGQSGQRVGPRPLLRLRQRFADHVELARLFDELRLELGRARCGLGELVHQGLDQHLRIDAGLGAAGDLADRLDLRAVVGDGRVQELLAPTPAPNAIAGRPDGRPRRRCPSIRHRSCRGRGWSRRRTCACWRSGCRWCA